MKLNSVCMYTKLLYDDATLKSGDHIFLAAIGGIKKLPKNYVSHEANNYFSKLEKRFVRDYPVSINRQFEGPGKRGNLNENKSSKSNVCVVSSQADTHNLMEKYSLAYIKLAKPYIINHLSFSFETKKCAVSLAPYLIKDGASQEQALKTFIASAKKIQDYILIVEEKLPATLMLLGELEEKWFLAVNNKALVPSAKKFIDTIQSMNSVNIKDSKETSSIVKAYQHYKIDINENNRIIAKMAFNLLAFDKGNEFVLDSKFDLIRNWIYTGTNDKNFVEMILRDKDFGKDVIPFLPNRAHYIIILQEGAKLIALVSLYGETYSYLVELASLDSIEIIIQEPIALICDWKNRKEYTLLEYLKIVDARLSHIRAKI